MNNDIELKNTNAVANFVFGQSQNMHVLDSNKETEVLANKVRMTPIILKKKINDKANIIPLKTPNILGQTRHFPAATKEWSSSVYAYYSNNDIKSIPLLDKNLVKLIKSFLNFYHRSEILKSQPIHIRFRRLSLKKIFVNKAELKHTNSKVIINIHVYNIQKRLLLKEFNKMKESVLYPKKNHNFQLSFPKRLNMVKSAVYNLSPIIYIILIQSIEKEKLLIIKNLAKTLAKQQTVLNKEDIPYFYYLMKQRLYKAYTSKVIEKEKYLICKFNLENKSINEWNYPSIFSLLEDLEREKLIINNIIRPMLGKGTTGLLPQRSQSQSQSQSKSKSKMDLKKVYHAIPLYDSIIKEIRVKSRVNKVNPYLCCASETSLTLLSESLYKKILVKCLQNELELIRYYKFLLDLYDHKFKCLIPKLKELFSQIYKKKIEFNIVSLKHMYLNSDILTQAIVLKLKVRKNRLWRVLKSCLNMVKLPKTYWLKEIPQAIKSESLVDKIQKLDLDSLTSFVKLASPLASEARSIGEKEKDILLRSEGRGQDNDSLNLLLFGFMCLRPCNIYKGKTRFAKAYEGAYANSLMLKPNIVIGMPQLQSIWAINNFFFKSCLKHKAIGGVRLEAKGRLTRRFTASRSVFKLKWKGSLKNIDSSYKGLSAVMLRGHVKSNLQYSVKNTRNRIGSYGVKGWVSGK